MIDTSSRPVPAGRSGKRVVQTYEQLVAKAAGPERHVVGVRDAAAGRGVLQADCPFNDEQPGNLFVYQAPPHFHCFGCGARGTATKTATGYLLRAGA